MECLKPSPSMLVNGNLRAEFNLERDLRQGNPLSTFLFFLAVESLIVTIKVSAEANLFSTTRNYNEGEWG